MSEIFEMNNVAYGVSLLDKFQKSSTVIATSQQLCFGDLVSEQVQERHHDVPYG